MKIKCAGVFGRYTENPTKTLREGKGGSTLGSAWKVNMIPQMPLMLDREEGKDDILSQLVAMSLIA